MTAPSEQEWVAIIRAGKTLCERVVDDRVCGGDVHPAFWSHEDGYKHGLCCRRCCAELWWMAMKS